MIDKLQVKSEKLKVRTLSIIVPVFNEEKTILSVIKKSTGLKIPNWSTEVIIINDGSTDSSLKLIKDYGLKIKEKNHQSLIINHQSNLGKGEAIRSGLKVARGEIFIVQDADLEYDPKDILKLIKVYKAKEGIVLGSRNLKPKRKGYFHYVFGVWLLTFLTNLFFKTNLTDTYTCYKLMETKLAKSLNLSSAGFEIEMELVAKALKKGVSITEVPISYNPRTFAAGKKIGWRDGLKGLLLLIQIKFNT